MKMPEVGQNPREYHENLKSVVRFISESVSRIESVNKSIEECEMIDIGGKKYLDKSEVEEMISDFASKQDVKKLKVSTSKLIDEKLKPVAIKEEVNKLSEKLHGEIKSSTSSLAAKSELKKLESSVNSAIDDKLVQLATKNELDKLSDSLQCAIKSSTSNLAAKSELKQAVSGVSKSIAESSGDLTKKINEVKSIKHLSMSDVNDALEPYELTKDVNGKIKSCRDTMGENYDLYAKSLSKKLNAVTSGVDEFKKSQSLAYDKLEKETSKSIVETGQKLEKSILKKVLDKISKLMG